MATSARNIHRHTTASAVKLASEKQSPNPASNKVSVKFVPETPPHEEYKDFYPLNVSKVAEQKSVSPVLVIISIIFVLAAAAAAGWYVVQQQENVTNEESTSNVTTASNPTNKIYKNADYGFNLTLPVSWLTVTANEASVEQSNTSPLVKVRFILPNADVEGTNLTLMELEVYTAENWQSLNESIPSDQLVSLPRRIGVAGKNIVTVKNEAQVAIELSKMAETAISDIANATASFEASQ